MNNFEEFGLRFDFVFPTFFSWQTQFSNTLVPVNDPDMEKYYKIIFDRYSTRYLKWSNEYQLVGIMTPLIVDTFFKFKQYLVMYNKLYDELYVDNNDEYVYGLPGNETEITSENQKKYVKVKGRRQNQHNNLDIIKELNKLTELMSKTIDDVAKWFLPFINIQGGFSPI